MARGYISVDLDRRIREAAQNRCGYCLTQQRLIREPLQIEHLIPVFEGGTDDESNLWLACSSCNGHKATKIRAFDSETMTLVPLFNPRTQRWIEHFQWGEDGTRIIGLSPVGRAAVTLLHINDEHVVELRRLWVSAGWHPPKMD